jgi:glycosyltransferase involved in cell wall biosynthesis
VTAARSITSLPHAPVSPVGRWLQVLSHVHPKYGGLSSTVPEMGNQIARTNRFEMGLAAFCAPDEAYHPSGYADSNLTFWPSSRRTWISAPSLRKPFSEEVRTYHGVHIHGLWEHSTLLASRAARSMGKPYLLSAHGMLEPWARANKRLKKYVYGLLIEQATVARATALHALTRAEAQHYLDFGARSPIVVIPNAVEVPKRKDPSAFLASFPDLRDKRIILFLSRLHPKKGLDLLVRAWKDLHARWPDARLVIAGPDFEGTRAKLEDYISSNGLEDSIVFTGMLNESLKWSAFAAAECFVLPSYSEGLSVSALEAMGAGLPVIVTPPCNMPEVRQYETGWEIEAEIGPLTIALEEFLDNSSFENLQIGCRGADLVATRYSYPTITRQLGDVYEWLQGGPTPRNIEIVFP